MRTKKWLALTLSGGTLLAIGGCIPVLQDLFVQALLSQLVQALLSAFNVASTAA